MTLAGRDWTAKVTTLAALDTHVVEDLRLWYEHDVIASYDLSGVEGLSACCAPL